MDGQRADAGGDAGMNVWDWGTVLLCLGVALMLVAVGLNSARLLELSAGFVVLGGGLFVYGATKWRRRRRDDD